MVCADGLFIKSFVYVSGDQTSLFWTIDKFVRFHARDSACKFLLGKIQYFSSYLIIERSEAFNPVSLRGAWD